MISIEGISVCLVLPCYSGSVPVEVCLALSKLVADVPRYGASLSILAEVGNSLPTTARNSLLTKFLATDSEYIFWLDDDIVFETEDFLRVLALTVQKKSVAGLYCTKQDTPRFIIKQVGETTEEGLIPSRGTGMGFSCQHRSLIEEIAQDKETYQNDKGDVIVDVFKTQIYNNRIQGEDIGFFSELYQNGYTTYIFTDVNLKHVGRKLYNNKL